MKTRIVLGAQLLVCGLLVLFAPGRAFAASLCPISWITVGNPGNAADSLTGHGAVASTFKIGEFEVTNCQYAEFLNAVAASDTNGLYNTSMGSSAQGGITRTGTSGSYVYAAKTGFDNKPVNFVSFWDAIRFANWLDNGQPTGTQKASTTEDGAYTITTQGVTDNTIVRNSGALVFLPSQDEWYKAAYYDPATSTYSLYPMQSDATPTCIAPGFASSNAANCAMGVAGVTIMGSYTLSPSFYGTSDQGGNVAEWDDTIAFTTSRFRLGGGWTSATAATDLAATKAVGSPPASEDKAIGFRVAAVPEPGTIALSLAAGLSLLFLRRVRKVAAPQA